MAKRHVFLIITGTLLSAGLGAEQFTFDKPRHNAYRVDACRTWGAGCGQEAADAFCRLHSYERAATFEIDPKIGAVTPTMTLGDQRLCNQPNCDGFKSITCVRAGSGRLHLPTPLKQPPAGQPSAPPQANPPANEPANPPPAGGVTTLPPGLRGKIGALPPTAPSPPAPSAPPAPVPAPVSPPSVLMKRLDPEEFVIIAPKQPTATLGRFGSQAPAGLLEEKRDVALKTSADLVQTGAADVDGDGQSELILLETPDPLKPGNSQLNFYKLVEGPAFAPIAETGVFISKQLPLLVVGEFFDQTQQPLVYAPGEGAAVIRWKAPSATDATTFEYVFMQGWTPKGALMALDATGDGLDDLLDYNEAAGTLDLVTLGAVETPSAGERISRATARPLATLGPGRRFAIGDFTGDGRTDLLIHDGTSSTLSIAQFDDTGAIRSTTPIAADWPATHTWTAGSDYDGDGRDDLLISDPNGMVALVRFTGSGGIRDTQIVSKPGSTTTTNLRFSGYFMANGRASYLVHIRKYHDLDHFSMDFVGDTMIVQPNGDEPRTLVHNVPEGALVVVGNFRKDR